MDSIINFLISEDFLFAFIVTALTTLVAYASINYSDKKVVQS